MALFRLTYAVKYQYEYHVSIARFKFSWQRTVLTRGVLHATKTTLRAISDAELVPSRAQRLLQRGGHKNSTALWGFPCCQLHLKRTIGLARVHLLRSSRVHSRIVEIQIKQRVCWTQRIIVLSLLLNEYNIDVHKWGHCESVIYHVPTYTC